MSMLEKEELKLSPTGMLENIEKQKCNKCQKNRMYFCYDCRLPMPGVFNPSVKLPCLVDVIKHPMEKNSKSSALHCKIVAPQHTRVFDYPDVFDYRTENGDPAGSTVLVFPSPAAISIEEFVKTNGPIKRFVVLDCTWFQVGVMQKIPQIQELPCVSLRNYKTAFWRPQHNVNEAHLATIEAIYYALREYEEHGLQRNYNGDFDDLLFWFFFTRDKVNAKQEEYLRKRDTIVN